MKNKIILEKLDSLVPNPKCSLKYEKDYELLIAVMLSAQSTDERVNSVTPKLFSYSLEELNKLSLKEIEEIIKPVGTFHRKAEYIKEITNALITKYNSKVPFDRKKVESIKGVGHKTCNVIFAELFNDNTIAVDTHVSRVSKRLNLAKDSDDVKLIEEKLKKVFPKEKWSRLHLQLVLFGRHKCKAINPICEGCPFYKKECIYKKIR